MGFHAFSVHHSPRICVCSLAQSSPDPTLLVLYRGLLMQASWAINPIPAPVFSVTMAALSGDQAASRSHPESPQ